MKIEEIKDITFLHAVQALDAGKLDEVQDLINQHPRLVRDRMSTSGETGYFKDPYLIWFLADNPVRIPALPGNVLEILHLLIKAVKLLAPDTYIAQLNYTLELVATGRIPRECGVQIAMMDALIDAGATPGNGVSAIANGNLAAAGHLIDRGGAVTLTAAVLLERPVDMDIMFDRASDPEKLTALTAASFYGKTAVVKYLLDRGVDPNNYPSQHSGFHSHAAPLHQAVSAMSLDTVKMLINSGARLDMKDKRFGRTPMEWADYLNNEAKSKVKKDTYIAIAAYLKNYEVHNINKYKNE